MYQNKEYYQRLNDQDKLDYQNKCCFINFVDPYPIEKDKFTNDCEMWPSLHSSFFFIID